MLTRTALLELKRSIADASGDHAAGEVLFRFGRRWGESDAETITEPGGLGRRFEAGLRRLDELGLGMARIEHFEHDAERKNCRIVGRIFDLVELTLHDDTSHTPEGAACGLTAGYVTGLASRLSGLDMICSPFHCPAACDASTCTLGCPFELRPAHTQRSPAPGTPAPAGSARFFLGALGAVFGDADIALADLVENSGDAVILIDSQDVVRFWNRGAEAMFGHRREEVVGRKVGFIVPEDLLDSDELGWIKAKIDREGTLCNYVTRRIHKDGSELSVNLTRTVLHDSQGKVIGSTAIIRDVTAHLRAESELQSARHLALIGEMAATVAHEIKNPLTGIYSAIQVLSRGPGVGNEQKEIFEDIGNEIRRLDDTVVDLLRFARPAPPRPVPTGLRSLVDDVVARLEHHPEVARHCLEIEVGEDHVAAVDQGMMLQTLQNLIVNAAQAMEEGGTIRIESAADGSQLELTVTDTGPGVPPDELDSIFEPFVTTKARGTGLGLSIARKNVEAHRGAIEATNVPGGGARFRMSLPVAP